MKPVLYLLMLSLALSACGVKGGLTRPSDIKQEEKKEKLPNTSSDTTL